jgi:hypothetical protein
LSEPAVIAGMARAALPDSGTPWSQSFRLKMTYKLVQTPAISNTAKGYPNTRRNSGMWSKFIP